MTDPAPKTLHDGARLTTTATTASARLAQVVEIVSPDGARRPVPVTDVSRDGDELRVAGANDELAARLVARPSADPRILDLDLEVTWTGAPADVGLRVTVELPGRVVEPRWLVPGCFYRENRPEGTALGYPRAVVGADDPTRFDSSWWSFRSDRAAMAAVFGWTDTACVGIATDPVTPLGMTGVGFRADAPAPQVWIDLPYREEPVVYRGHPTPGEPVVSTHHWRPGARQQLSLSLLLDDPTPHAYDPLVRARYERDRLQHPLAPWIDVDVAAELTAHGLHTWHWRPEHEVFYVTASFDRVLTEGDRATMHVAWIGGVPWAHALLTYGRRSGDERYVDAGARVIDHVCSVRTPGGTFWGEWRLDRGWGCGWNRDPDRLHARTLAEATLFTVRAVEAERAHGVERPSWMEAVADNLEAAVAAQSPEGDLGAYYHQATAEVVDRTGAAGVLWIPALIEGGRLLGRPEYLEVARRAGHYYSRFVEDAFIYGAPEDVHTAPSSEDAYNAVIAYVRLHEADDDPRWLRLARLAADWMMTFRWSYDVSFDRHTILHHYGFRTRGADSASPPNQHLGAYGLIALEEMLALWRHTGDDHYLDRARDNLACFLQFIARADGDFNARRGMATERYYHTDYLQPKGSLLTLSHAWCLGVTLLAAQVAMDDPEAFPPGLGWASGAGREVAADA